MTNIQEITEALDSFRSKNGTHWKSKLKELYFSNQNSNPYLQQFRNKFSFNILEKIKYHTTKREITEILTNSS